VSDRRHDQTIRRASVLATLGLVLMVATTATYIAWPRVAGAIGLKPAAPPPAYAAGDRFDGPAAWYEGAPRTLVIFARASCAACEKAQPFLKTLVAGLGDGAVAVMAHPPGAPQEDAQFASSLGVADSRIVLVGPDLRVRSTPTLVLVDRTGVILHAWEGVGPKENQDRIAQAVEAALR
jgi:hypothetical protein